MSGKLKEDSPKFELSMNELNGLRALISIQDELPFILWLGVNGLAAMALLQLGLQREKAGRVGILNNSIVIFTYIFQVWLTDDQGQG